MTDTVLRGTGNSRTLRTVADALARYPDHVSMIQAMINGTFPIDIGSLSSAGLTRRGTDLNKANILTDATATGMGLTSSATPNDAFAKLWALVKAAQDDADTALGAGVYLQTGSYAGNDERTKIIRFSRPWHLFAVRAENDPYGEGVYPAVVFRDTVAVIIGGHTDDFPNLLGMTHTSTDTSLTMIFGSSSMKNYPNAAKRTYNWWAI